MTSASHDFSSAAPVEPIAHLPCNIEAEQALLGAVLFDNAAYERLTDKLSARHFYEPFHQRLFQAMEEHIRKGQLAEPIVLMERFRADAAFEALGGLRYLADLVDRAPPAANAPDYARVIYDLALRRDLIRIGGEISVNAGGDHETEARDQIETAEQQLYTLAETGGASQGFQTFANALAGRGGDHQRGQGSRGGAGGPLHRPDRPRSPARRPAPVRPRYPGGAPLDGEDGAGHQHRLQRRQGLLLRDRAGRLPSHFLRRGRGLLLAWK